MAFERLVEQSNRLKVLNRDLAHEIHERKQAEAALAQLNATLETSVAERTAEAVAEKNKSEAILRSVGDAISVTDLDMRIQYVNEAFVTLTGHSSAEVIGRAMYTLMVQETAELDRRSRQFAWQTGAYTQREVIILRYVLSLSLAETAAALERSEGAIKQLQLRALAGLRGILAGPTGPFA